MSEPDAPTAGPPRGAAADPPPSALHEGEPDAAGVNRVQVRGRLGAAPQARELPSGDRLMVFRLVVPRVPAVPRRPEEERTPARRAPTVDTLDCAAWGAALQDRLRHLPAGAQVEVVGRLQRRFWRAGAAVQSRCEVQADSLQVLSAGASADPPAASG